MKNKVLKTGLKTGFKTAAISLSIFAVASASTLGLTQVGTQLAQTSAQETPLYAHHHNQDEDYDMQLDYYLEDYKEGYRDGFMDGFQAALEELEGMFFEDEFGFENDEYDGDYWDEDENVTILDAAPDGLEPTYLPQGMVFEDAYSYTDEDGLTDEGVFYFNEANESYIDINRLNLTLDEAMELYGEDLMAEVSELPSKDIEGTIVYIEQSVEEDEDYITAYFNKADGLYTIDSNLSEAEMNVILSSLLGQ